MTSPSPRVAVLSPAPPPSRKKKSDTKGKEPLHQASCFRRVIEVGEDFHETLLETAVQLTAVFATASKVHVHALDRLHCYSMM